MTPSLALYISFLVAASMLAVMLFSIYIFEKNNHFYVNFAFFLSFEMFGMNTVLYYYFNFLNVLNSVIISGIFMFGGFLMFIREFQKDRLTSIMFSIIITIAEISMGVLITSLTVLKTDILSGIGSPWFIYVMSVEMLFSLVISYKKMDKVTRNYFTVFILLMPLFPNLYQDTHLVIWISSFIMIILTVIIFDSLYRTRSRKGFEVYISIEMIIIFALMMVGEFYFFLYGTWDLYFITMTISMVWFLYRIFERPRKRDNYLTNNKLAFLLIFLTFIMEWFMGGILEFNAGQFGSGIDGFLSNLALGWSNPSNPLNIIFDTISIIVTVTASPWFLIMMGLEMGFLSFRKILAAKIKENRVRLGLMISAYAIYSVFIPYFSPLSSKLKYIPYMWSMGIGTNGPVTNSVLIAIVGTYLISALLSFLFGARQLCSVTCTAPMMYQGTFYDSLKKYNRTSKIGRKTLTSKIMNWFKFVVLFINILVLASAILSYLDSRGYLSIYIFGNDPSYVAYALMFNLVWYVGFIMSPFMGTYACVNQGWCYWGTFNQAIGRLGFFKLKVRDPSACLNCKTVDCASACPVGITDMRSSFIRSGDFKSFKCIGVGDCVEACPYDNIFFYDVRHVINGKFQKKK